MANNLPFELIEEIVRRLPAKSLKRFRAVAKSWCFLIDSDSFIKSHLRHSQIANSNRHLLIFGLGLYTVGLDSLDRAHALKPPFYYKSVDGISNSCNGIVLVMSDPPVLYNPFTKEYKVLPNSTVEHHTPSNCYSKMSYGFGYDSRNDNYKAVRVVEFRHELSHIWISSETEIYSFRSNCWRRIEGFPYPLPFLKGYWRVHVNGALHTFVEDFVEARIMAFSVDTENHYQLPMPPAIRIKDVDVSLDVIDGCLSAICCTRSNRVSVWVMKDYGVKESWIKMLTISPPVIERNDFVRPVVYSRDGDRVLLNCDDKRLIWYDLKNKTVDNVDVEGMPFVFYPEVCVESLVVLDDRDEVKKKGKVKRKIKEKKEKMRNKR
ncbi:hypothetical protein CASFOL_040615 [Castilleja foliolosa]|uniref:F-box domain-containing protein n=1 Tax=Castilleja foliolosa TaxID=1961234 RepID=A0ABD3BCH1_9LAMI